MSGKFIQLTQLATFLANLKSWVGDLFLAKADAAAVATSGAASDVSVADSSNVFTGANVEAVLKELYDSHVADDVTFEKLVTPTTGKLASYKFTKGTGAGATEMVIDIEKDLMNDTLELVTITESGGKYYDGETEVTAADGVTSAGVYMKYNTAPHGDTPVYKYANMAGVIEYITVPQDQSTAMVVLTLDANHVLSAAIRDGSIPKAKLDQAVQNVLDAAPQKLNVPNIQSLTAAQCDALKVGDTVTLTSSNDVKDYIVTFKNETTGNLTLTYHDHESVIDVKYDKSSNNTWGHKVTQTTDIGTALHEADLIIATDEDIEALFEESGS